MSKKRDHISPVLKDLHMVACDEMHRLLQTNAVDIQITE